MKKSWLSTLLLVGSLSMPIQALAQPQIGSVKALLQKMGHTSQTSTYELSFININSQGIVPIRYRHTLIDGKPLAQLMQMDSTRREIVQRGDEISYFEPGLDAFSLRNDHIVDYIPSIIYQDFNELSDYYNFIDAGRTHIGDIPSRVVRVLSKNNDRYDYVLFIDEERYLPLRVDLLDKNNDIIEQFRVITVNEGSEVETELNSLRTVNMPPLLLVPKAKPLVYNWSVSQLPEGFKEVKRSHHQISETEFSQSILFSDGLFDFSIYVNKSGQQVNSPERDKMLRYGRNTIYTYDKEGNEITFIGQLPFSTAQKIVNSVVFTKK
ncbi:MULTISPECIES: sigma-E factor regulatory protein RseB [Proteus]|uniref:Sigma-E factor regulatory protein RseB n=1 Tax=Proteus penneri TaxID=102862 RepID=A0A0G4Q4M6_9GAMM|nr:MULTISPECIES: sigma-E factor regulatory protein RseB [Proteus]MBJ2117093.1 sigma-E factor regulatory protein RseB [Proteus penneri]MCO8049395.1 sigma-E factor regulatory protein RseB [Proteus penneri]MCX2587437.1 sigma-E factor regulatory protein RseB [Proteus penneri]NBL78979.1 sigma-E factor regulatory protein RseB [Proteus sp. G2672]NBL91239.1 sigma-E factor regulatory protein RseB [Proteus sp. G2673]